MPPAHEQLLSDDGASSAALKGEDHTRVVSGREPSWCRREVSAGTTRQWLLESLGSLGLGDRGEDDATPPPGLARASSDDDSFSAASSLLGEDCLQSRTEKRVSFAPAVAIQPIPHSSELSAGQRGRMFATPSATRRNKARNKFEFRYDGWNWRTATEERDMDVTPTGEEIHPAHHYADMMNF